MKKIFTKEQSEAVQEIINEELSNKNAKFETMKEKRGARIMEVLIQDNMNTFSNFNSIVRVAQRIKDGNFNPNHSEETKRKYIEKYAVSDNILKELERVKTLLQSITAEYYGKE